MEGFDRQGRWEPRNDLERAVKRAADEAAAAGGHGSIGIESGDSGLSWYWGERQILIAYVNEGSVELRLRPDVAAAAAKTPNAQKSHRGPSWVSFSPTELDRFAMDRLKAWFAFAAKEAERLGAEWPDGAPPGWPPD